MKDLQVSTTAAVIGMVGLGVLSMWMGHGDQLAIAVVSALAGWLSHKSADGKPS